MSSSTPTSAPEPPPLRFDGLHIRDKHGSNVASVRAEVTRRGVTLVGKKGTLGSFPFQSIGSWAHAGDTTLSLIVTANGAQREVVVAGDPATITAVLAAIDATVNDIIEEMTKPERRSAREDRARRTRDARSPRPRPPTTGPGPGPGPRRPRRRRGLESARGKNSRDVPDVPDRAGEDGRGTRRMSSRVARRGADAAAAQASAARRRRGSRRGGSSRRRGTSRGGFPKRARRRRSDARDYAAAASLDVTPNPESEPGGGSALPAAARLAETTSRLESSESLIKALGEELERARAEADAARASARQPPPRRRRAPPPLPRVADAERPRRGITRRGIVRGCVPPRRRRRWRCVRTPRRSDLRLLLESAETDARRHAERADAAVSDAETAWARAAEAHEGTRALADELKRAKRAADDARVEGERALRRAERAAARRRANATRPSSRRRTRWRVVWDGRRATSRARRRACALGGCASRARHVPAPPRRRRGGVPGSSRRGGVARETARGRRDGRDAGSNA